MKFFLLVVNINSWDELLESSTKGHKSKKNGASISIVEGGT
jgi:hypothetical protein